MQKTTMMLEYAKGKGEPTLEVVFDGDSIWLTQDQIASLFDTTVQNVGQHIRNIYADGELDEKSTLKKIFKVVDNRPNYGVIHYNLDVVISVGYRVSSKVATRFRQWATEIIPGERVAGDYSVLAQEEALRLLTRAQVDDGTEHLLGVATTKHKVKDEKSFLEAGNEGMYHMTSDQVEVHRKIPAGKLYDYIGSAELGMHVYRLTQTAEALKIDARRGERHTQTEAEEVHKDISERTRAMSHELHGQHPEDMPTAQNIEAVRQKHRALLKKPKAPKNDPSQEKLGL